MKIAFVHIMKTGGSTVTNVLNKTAFRPHRYLQIDPECQRENDWSDQELRGFLSWNTDRLYVHNHAKNWEMDTISEYVKQGWFTFSFYRHPGDQWCSFYFWSQEANNERFKRRQTGRSRPFTNELTLDEFLRLGWSDNSELQSEYKNAMPGLRKNLDLPERWREMNFVALYSNQNFKSFLKKYLGKRTWMLEQTNTSSNSGYEHYRRKGLISKTTHELLMDSERYDNYQKLLEKPHERGHEQFLTANSNVFLNRRQRLPGPVLYVILFAGSAGSNLLTSHFKDHPHIQAFEEEFDKFPSTWANQKKWLRNFYVRLPKKDRSIQALGFNTKLTSISDTSRFREFLEQHQVRVIYLTRTNPVKMAVSDVLDRRRRERCGGSHVHEPSHDSCTTQISVEEFHEALKCEQRSAELDEYVSTLDVPKLRLEYEELQQDEAAALHRIWMFLGVGLIKMSAKLPKNNVDNLDEIVLNLDELRAAFPGYEEHFVECANYLADELKIKKK